MTACAGCGAEIGGSDLDAMCQACDLDAELAVNKILDNAGEKLIKTLNDDNATKLRRMRPELRREVVRRAIDAGVLAWKIT